MQTGSPATLSVRQRCRSWILRWFQPAGFLLIGAWICGILAVIAIGSSVFADGLVAGPDFVVESPQSAADASGITTFTPTTLEHSGLRIGWAIGSALILLGVAFGLLSVAQAAVNEGSRPIFSERSGAFFNKRFTFALTLLAAGATVRWGIEGRIAAALEIQTVYGEDDFDLWIFDIPLLVVLLSAQLAGMVWHRASSLQSEVDGIV